MKIESTFVGICCLAFALQACTQDADTPSEIPTQKEVNKSMEEINRQFLKDEELQINGYINRRGWDMTTTGTGLRYEVIAPGEGKAVAEGSVVKVKYEVSLMDGTVVYSSDESGEREFLVGKDNVETGLHEGVTYLRQGDKARIILPSHLAHGLTGDQNKIPPRSTVIYNIEILEVR